MMIFAIYSIILIVCLSTRIECKREEPICVQHSETVGAYPCESRPTREPLSLQYSKAQSDVPSIHQTLSFSSIAYLLVSKPAPPFEGIAVVNGEFKEISLQDFKNKYLVLLFYPLDLYVDRNSTHSSL